MDVSGNRPKGSLAMTASSDSKNLPQPNWLTAATLKKYFLPSTRFSTTVFRPCGGGSWWFVVVCGGLWWWWFGGGWWWLVVVCGDLWWLVWLVAVRGG